MSKLKYFIFYIFFLVVYVVIFLSVLQHLDREDKQNHPPSTRRKKNEVKWILLWNKLWGSSVWKQVKLYDTQNYLKNINCPETRCVIVPVSFRHLRPLEEYDAIIFNGAELKPFREESLPDPNKRHSDQVFVYASQESPRDYWKQLKDYKNYFNYTMSYRFDSDSKWNYFKIIDLKTNAVVAPSRQVKWRQSPVDHVETGLQNALFQKKHLDLIWIVSNCYTESKRNELFDELAKNFSCRKFGKCGESCEGSNICQLHDLAFKFYGSFENTLCKDYVTEKLTRALSRKIVPIVYGGSDYSHFAPPNSYIDANNFETIDDLKKYLKTFEKSKEYSKFFWWKDYYKIEDTEDKIDPFCNLCQTFHRDRIQEKRKVYKDISRWWENGMCLKKPKIKF